MNFLTGLSYVLQQPPTARLANTKADNAKKKAHSCSSCWPGLRVSCPDVYCWEPCGGGQLKGHLVVYGRRDQLADPY